MPALPAPVPPPDVVFTTSETAATLPLLPTKFPPLPQLKLPQFKQVTLENGLRLYMLEDHEVPLVQGTMLMRGGQYASPADKVGLASLSAYTQRGGGSTAHPESRLDEALEELSASIELGAGQQAISAAFGCLAEDTDKVVELFAEVIRSPALPASKLALYQSQVLNLLEHKNDDAGQVARRRLQALVYGSDSIYARQPKEQVVVSITTQDVRKFLETWERPDTAVLGIVGDFDPAAMEALVRRTLGSWRPAPGQPAQAPLVAPAALPPQSDVSGRVFLVDKPGLTQTSVAMGEPGTQLMDPSVYSLDILSGIFNSFGGRLFDQIRSREGLAYSVGGGWDSPIDHPGLFVAGGDTSRPGEFLKLLQQALDKATREAPTEEEVSKAKAETMNSFVFNFASKTSQMSRKLVYELLGLPQDFLFTYYSGIGAVDRSSVQKAAQQYLHPDKQTVVVVADAAKVQPVLEAAGFSVTRLPLD